MFFSSGTAQMNGGGSRCIATYSFVNWGDRQDIKHLHKACCIELLTLFCAAFEAIVCLGLIAGRVVVNK